MIEFDLHWWGKFLIDVEFEAFDVNRNKFFDERVFVFGSNYSNISIVIEY